MPNGTETEIRDFLLEHIGESFDISGNPVGYIAQTTTGEPQVILSTAVTYNGTPYSSLSPTNIAQFISDPNFPWPTGQFNYGNFVGALAQNLYGTGGGGVADAGYDQLGMGGAIDPQYMQSIIELQNAQASQQMAQASYYNAYAEVARLSYELDRVIADRDWAYQNNQLEYARQQDEYANQLQQAMFQWQQQLDAYDAQLQQASLALQQQQYAGQYGLDLASLGLQQQMTANQYGLSAAELAQRQYEYAQELQRSPINWIQAWQATRGMPFDVGGQQFYAPEIPAWQNYNLPASQMQNVNIPAWTGAPVNPPEIPSPTPVPTTAPTTPEITPTPSSPVPANWDQMTKEQKVDWVRAYFGQEPSYSPTQQPAYPPTSEIPPEYINLPPYLGTSPPTQTPQLGGGPILLPSQQLQQPVPGSPEYKAWEDSVAQAQNQLDLAKLDYEEARRLEREGKISFQDVQAIYRRASDAQAAYNTAYYENNPWNKYMKAGLPDWVASQGVENWQMPTAWR